MSHSFWFLFNYVISIQIRCCFPFFVMGKPYFFYLNYSAVFAGLNLCRPMIDMFSNYQDWNSVLDDLLTLHLLLGKTKCCFCCVNKSYLFMCCQCDSFPNII